MCACVRARVADDMGFVVLFTLQPLGQLHGLHQLLCNVERVEAIQLLLPEQLRRKRRGVINMINTMQQLLKPFFCFSIILLYKKVEWQCPTLILL